MIGNNIAVKYTQVAAASTDTLINNGEAINVFGIVINGTANGLVLFEEANPVASTVEIMSLSVLANSSVIFNIPFKAHLGIKVTTPASVTCTVFHSHSGA